MLSWLKLAKAAGNVTENDQKMTKKRLPLPGFGSLVDFCARFGEIGKNSVRLGEKLVKKVILD